MPRQLRPLREALINGGRTWWAHIDFTRINITPTTLRKKIEDRMEILRLARSSGAF